MKCRAVFVAATALVLGLAMGGCGGDDDRVQAPVLAPIGDRTVVLGSDLLIAVTATDPEGDPVTLSASGLPDNSYFLPDSGIFCLYADNEDQLEQPLQVTFTASDGTFMSSETVTIRAVRPDAAALVELQTLFRLHARTNRQPECTPRRDTDAATVGERRGSDRVSDVPGQIRGSRSSSVPRIELLHS